MTEHVLLVGNPGTGKSTLLNSLIGMVVFRSGVSIATGLTSHVQWHEHEGIMYGDTPGLADVTHRTQAAREISEVTIHKLELAQLHNPNLDLNLDLDWVCCVCVKALRVGGKFKIMFVCTLESGRIQAADLTTIKLVLDAIGDNTLPFGIVVNKVNKSRLRYNFIGSPLDFLS
jgi:energy-coupling factor transporter ATP-binding protein EcfA2